MSLLEQKLKEIAQHGYSTEVIASLEAVLGAVSDVSYPVGEKDSLELRHALRFVLRDSIDKLSKYRKMLIRGDKTPLND